MTNQQRLQEYIDITEKALDQFLKPANQKIVDAMRYSALSGGKRLRPVLTMEFCRISGGLPQDALPFACALEMIHTYSLIHDDLPCMDDDDLRRGKPTNHKVYGEGIAVLAGDALLTYAFETALASTIPPAKVVQATQILAHEAGYHGMIGGQVLDLEGEHQILSYDMLIDLQSKKTGGLIRAASKMGCIIGGATQAQTQGAETYANQLGLAFQIQDDILDIEGDVQVFGKPIGSDEKSGKSTFPKLLGLEKCKQTVQTLTEEAIQSLSSFPDTDFLCWLANKLVQRKK